MAGVPKKNHSRPPICLSVCTCRNSAEQFASRPALGWRPQLDAEGKKFGPYTFMTYKEAWDKAVKVSTDGQRQPAAWFGSSLVLVARCSRGGLAAHSWWLMACAGHPGAKDDASLAGETTRHRDTAHSRYSSSRQHQWQLCTISHQPGSSW